MRAQDLIIGGAIGLVLYAGLALSGAMAAPGVADSLKSPGAVVGGCAFWFAVVQWYRRRK
jgi:uncharacterized membrane-anchored protein YjiN (DUF445 family)